MLLAIFMEFLVFFLFFWLWKRRKNGIFSLKLIVFGFFIYELLSHVKNYMNCGKIAYSPINQLFLVFSHKLLSHVKNRENGLFSFKLIVPGFFIYELLSHVKNYMNCGKIVYSPIN